MTVVGSLVITVVVPSVDIVTLPGSVVREPVVNVGVSIVVGPSPVVISGSHNSWLQH